MSVYLRVVPHVQYIWSSRSMTTESFLLALTWMMSRRGKIDMLWSDNFKLFKNADKELRQCWEVISSDNTQENRIVVFAGSSFALAHPTGGGIL